MGTIIAIRPQAEAIATELQANINKVRKMPRATPDDQEYQSVLTLDALERAHRQLGKLLSLEPEHVPQHEEIIQAAADRARQEEARDVVQQLGRNLELYLRPG